MEQLLDNALRGIDAEELPVSGRGAKRKIGDSLESKVRHLEPIDIKKIN